MRQQHRQARGLLPFVFAGGDILIDDRLRDVVEIAELRFPHHQRIPGDDRITVFKSKHACFGKGTVEYFEAATRLFMGA